MSEAALVYLEEDLVGEIENLSGTVNLKYDENWKKNHFPISHSLPFDGSFSNNVSHNFFDNLLPEGHIRDLICKALKISHDNDWSLLLALGKESAGALTILEKPRKGDPPKEYEKISAENLAQFSTSKSVMPQIITKEATRLSLAGAQDKLAVFFDGENFWLPKFGSPTNTILKFENDDYRQLTANEVFVTKLARAVGLNTTNCRLYTQTPKPIAIFERYDRPIKDNGKMSRRHQEDLCQTLGISRKLKYEKEGGPGINSALNIISKISNRQLKDRRQIVRWQIFNVLCGNSDGHGKNISFFRDENGSELTPFYDLVCTRVFKKIDTNLAMNIAGTTNPDLFDRHRINAWSKEIKFGSSFLFEEVQQMLDLIENKLDPVEKQFISDYGEHGILEQIRLFIRKQIRLVRNSIQ